MTERRPDDAGPLAPPRSLGQVQERGAPARTLEQPVVGSADARAAQRPQAAQPSTAERPSAAPQAAPRPTQQPPTAPGRAEQPPSAPPQGATARADRPPPDMPQPVPARAQPAPAPRRRPSTSRRATLRLARIDPWSVMKTALLLSLAFGIVVFVAVAVVWSVLDAANVWDAVNRSIADVVGGQSGANFDVQNYIGMQRVLGFTAMVAVADVILLTAIATLSAFLYNLAASLLGGLEVTLAED